MMIERMSWELNRFLVSSSAGWDEYYWAVSVDRLILTYYVDHLSKMIKGFDARSLLA